MVLSAVKMAILSIARLALICLNSLVQLAVQLDVTHTNTISSAAWYELQPNLL